jgi:hypothetical protein
MATRTPSGAGHEAFRLSRRPGVSWLCRVVRQHILLLLFHALRYGNLA